MRKRGKQPFSSLVLFRVLFFIALFVRHNPWQFRRERYLHDIPLKYNARHTRKMPIHADSTRPEISSEQTKAPSNRPPPSSTSRGINPVRTSFRAPMRTRASASVLFVSQRSRRAVGVCGTCSAFRLRSGLSKLSLTLSEVHGEVHDPNPLLSVVRGSLWRSGVHHS